MPLAVCSLSHLDCLLLNGDVLQHLVSPVAVSPTSVRGAYSSWPAFCFLWAVSEKCCSGGEEEIRCQTDYLLLVRSSLALSPLYFVPFLSALCKPISFNHLPLLEGFSFLSQACQHPYHLSLCCSLGALAREHLGTPPWLLLGAQSFLLLMPAGLAL